MNTAEDPSDLRMKPCPCSSRAASQETLNEDEGPFRPLCARPCVDEQSESNPDGCSAGAHVCGESLPCQYHDARQSPLATPRSNIVDGARAWLRGEVGGNNRHAYCEMYVGELCNRIDALTGMERRAKLIRHEDANIDASYEAADFILTGKPEGLYT